MVGHVITDKYTVKSRIPILNPDLVGIAIMSTYQVKSSFSVVKATR